MNSKTYVLLTIDTEASMHIGKPLPIAKMIYGDINGKQYGISKIMDICEQYGFKATFFVSVLESLHYGEEHIKKVCKSIYNRGHDVQLHIHPNWKYDYRFMWEYSVDEQTSLIKEGKELFHSWIGEYPIAHRAGGLAANRATLIALERNGIPVDSSMVRGSSFCKLEGVLPTQNAICVSDGVIEVPVTSFTQIKLGDLKLYRTLDINADTLSELIHVTKAAKKKGIRTVNLLMHSFSFLTRSKDRTKFKPNLADMNKFERYLKFLKNEPDIEVITIKDLYNLYSSNPKALDGIDYVPYSGFIRTFARIFKHFRISWKNKLLVFLIFAAIIIILSAITLWVW